MKKFNLLFALVLLSCNWSFAQQAKYVFYFIGDGMGVNQVQGTELFQGELKGEIGISPLCFTQFPVSTVATTFSATNGVTDSAAAGTALATGNKTKNGAIGVLKDLETPVNSVAVWAKNSGRRVGIATSVSVDHATPAAFYAHEAGRSSYYNIGADLYKAGFDFYAGSDFVEPENKKDKNAKNLYKMADEYGYCIARGYNEYTKKSDKADKMILFQSKEASEKDRSAIPYAIDRTEKDLSLEDITRSAIDFLSKDMSKGFFLMVEGGKIDWACHSNDAATAFREVQDFDNAIKIAYEFYKQHPDETLIVVTADHETGGIVLGTGQYKLNLKALESQEMSESGFTKVLNAMRKKYKNNVPWEVVKESLEENFGFWDEIKLTEKQEERLLSVYEKTLKGQKAKMEKSEYAQDEALAAEAKRIISETALIGWTSGGHSAGYVPVFAIGAGAGNFSGRLDNTQIPALIAKAAGYTVEK
ncbi:alkaline phosphatase [uncultured Bacteroides sp.]|uniref:alkaline phosphatase n=1 Tax=uncultured Bacteroides sp. TaxID=162156 RepID=UPI00262D58EE|nr:alkaline phosphatase [uncultured Bacteroides sp.]